MLLLLYALLFAYPVLQIAAFLLTRGRARLAAAAPLLLMIPIGVWTFAAYRANANLWPLVLLFATPAADVYLGMLLTVTRKPPRHPSAARHR